MGGGERYNGDKTVCGGAWSLIKIVVSPPLSFSLALSVAVYMRPRDESIFMSLSVTLRRLVDCR